MLSWKQYALLVITKFDYDEFLYFYLIFNCLWKNMEKCNTGTIRLSELRLANITNKIW